MFLLPRQETASRSQFSLQVFVAALSKKKYFHFHTGLLHRFPILVDPSEPFHSLPIDFHMFPYISTLGFVCERCLEKVTQTYSPEKGGEIHGGLGWWFNPKKNQQLNKSKFQPPNKNIVIGKMLVPLGWYPSCLTPQGAVYKEYMGLIIKGTIPRVPAFSPWHRHPVFWRPKTIVFSHFLEGTDIESRHKRQDLRGFVARLRNPLLGQSSQLVNG